MDRKRLKQNRRPNPRLVKIHRCYSVEEIAELFGVHRQTVRTWIKLGLPVIDKQRPMLVHGQELREYINQKRQKHKRCCGSGEIYCVKCRKPRQPVAAKVSLTAITTTTANLVGICPRCGITIYRRVCIAKIDQFEDHFNITLPETQKRLTDSISPP